VESVPKFQAPAPAIQNCVSSGYGSTDLFLTDVYQISLTDSNLFERYYEKACLNAGDVNKTTKCSWRNEKH